MKSKGKARHQIGSWLDMEEKWADELQRASSAGAGKSAPSKDSGKAKPPAKEKEKAKGKRVYTPWEKALRRQWKRLRKIVKRPGVQLAAGAAALALPLACLV